MNHTLRRLSAASLAAATLTAGLSAAAAPQTAVAATGVSGLSQVDCTANSRMVQLRANGTELWLSSVGRADSSTPQVYGWQKIYTLGATRPGSAVAVISTEDSLVRMLVTDPDGGMRSYTWNTETRAMGVKDLTPTAASKTYNFRRLTYDGTRLYGNRGTDLYVMTSVSTSAAPRAMAKVSGFNAYARSFFGNADTANGELSWTDYDGRLRVGDIKSGTDGWSVTTRTVTDRSFPEHTITSPGGGILLRDLPTGELWRHHLNTDKVTTSTATSLAAATGAPDLPVSTNPDICSSNGDGTGAIGERIASVAESQVGILESSREGEKYLDWNDDWDGLSVDTTPWCAGFVSWVVNYKTGATTFKSLLVQDWYLKAKGNQYGLSLTSSPRRGDIVVFDWDGSGDFGAPQSHMGIVTSVGTDGSFAFTSVEGNTGSPDGVYKVNRTRNASYKVAFIRIGG